MQHPFEGRSLLTPALACWLAFGSGATSAAPRTADLILANGHVYTSDARLRWAEAVAVKDGRIVYVGSNAGARARRGRDTREIDLGGRLLLPGFIDPHNHIDGRASEMFLPNLGSRLSQHTVEGYRQTLLDFRAHHPGLKQLRGNGFDP